MAYDPAMEWERECRRREQAHREWMRAMAVHIRRALELLTAARAELSPVFGSRHEIITLLDELSELIESEWEEP